MNWDWIWMTLNVEASYYVNSVLFSTFLPIRIAVSSSWTSTGHHFVRKRKWDLLDFPKKQKKLKWMIWTVNRYPSTVQRPRKDFLRWHLWTAVNIISWNEWEWPMAWKPVTVSLKKSKLNRNSFFAENELRKQQQTP